MSYSLLTFIVARLAQAANAGSAEITTGEAEYDVSPPFSTVEHESWSRLVHLWLQHGAPLLAGQEPRACPACGSSAARGLFTSHDGYPYNDCEDCGCWYVPRNIDPSLYERFFRHCPEAMTLAEAGFAKRASDENLTADLARIGAYLDLLLPQLPDGYLRYLDIGAGTGSSLVAAREKGLDALGVEAAPQSFAVAGRRNVRILDAKDGLPEGPFGLISLWETLEHLDDPLAVLQAGRSALAPGGLVAITIPNLDSPLTRIMRGDCSFVGGGSDGPGHVNLFGPEQLRRLFDRAGLSLIHLDGRFGSNYFELAGYVLGRHRGAADLLKQCPIRTKLPASVLAFLNSLGPALTTLERATLLSPIVLAVACRQEDRKGLDAVEQAMAAQREHELSETTAQLESGIVDTEARVASLQEEIAIRDRMLAGMERELKTFRSKRPLVRLLLEGLRGARDRLKGK
jgi:SAM-dependent methyltransferase